ncbi:glycoside hydrolase family 15 protein [Kitasatospora sp. NBC_01287]|uniref:glycoside hydrolase family 15 protein n=1 Tax=Kitasatospora sp. NBC_01287 TaxID=2903573 RepID=UPI002252E028|nr:glycoside hydrolase family 15 protein [Kitasatospora sp. NBC_01287]MCX4744219.1 glycoside hydrolase family 15 protein [Kitasatospora sp. NBC_01287]
MPGRIEDYAIVGDLRTAALIGTDGSVDWLCCPRFDSHAFFAALLGSEENGHWRIAPNGAGACTSRTYASDSLVLQTRWDQPAGQLVLTDFMPPTTEDAPPRLIRIAQCTAGTVEVTSELRLRFGYGQYVPWVRRAEGGHVAIAGPDAVWFRSDTDQRGEHRLTRSHITLQAGDRAEFELSWRPSHLPAPPPVDAQEVLRTTLDFWSGWIADCTYRGPWRAAVTRSLITLKALTYAPTGGIVAAATTSLPEDLGGERNWDYRFCWLRDATLTLSSLLRSGLVREAEAWREWLERAVAGSPEDLQIMYGVAGERLLPEAELDWLPGYEGARPVRSGNAAAGQLQLDVYGEVMAALHLARSAGLPPLRHAWDVQCALMDFLATAWREPDDGLWEVRGPRRHFVHSKVMAWVAADSVVKSAQAFQLPGPVARWRAMRDEIHREVCAQGFDTERNTFTQYYGSRELDAALLMIPKVGFLPADDPRVAGTVDAVARELDHQGFLRRYSTGGEGPSSVDGLSGSEGAFLACSFWLADALTALGREEQAHALFERLLAVRNDVGLLAEEWDPVAGRQVGNFPQAFSHVGLLDTALGLSGRPRLMGRS